jgi:hypothetical protein
VHGRRGRETGEEIELTIDELLDEANGLLLMRYMRGILLAGFELLCQNRFHRSGFADCADAPRH